MFQLHDLRESRVWQEAHEEGREEGCFSGKEAGKEVESQLIPYSRCL